MPIETINTCGCGGTFVNKFRDVKEHYDTDKHTKWAYENYLVQKVKKEMEKKLDEKVATINQMIEQVKKIQVENDELKKNNSVLETKLNNTKASNIYIEDLKNKVDELTTKLKESEIKNAELSDEIEALKIKPVVKEIETQTDTIDDDKESDKESDTLSITNYLDKEVDRHKKYIYLFEKIFGLKPLRFLKKGEMFYNEFSLIRSSYQYNYDDWKINDLHKTTYNMNQRIGIGIPIKSVTKDSDDIIYYINFHLYIKNNKIEALTGFNDVEYTILKYL